MHLPFLTECQRSANRTYNTAFPGSILGETKLFQKESLLPSLRAALRKVLLIPRIAPNIKQKIYRLLQDIN